MLKHLADLFREYEQLFLANGAHVPHPEEGFKTIEAFEAWVGACKQQLSDMYDVDQLSTLDLQLEELRDEKGKKTIEVFSSGHIHKMAVWRTATRFVEWMYKRWTALERSYIAAPIRHEPSAAPLQSVA